MKNQLPSLTLLAVISCLAISTNAMQKNDSSVVRYRGKSQTAHVTRDDSAGAKDGRAETRAVGFMPKHGSCRTGSVASSPSLKSVLSACCFAFLLGTAGSPVDASNVQGPRSLGLVNALTLEQSTPTFCADDKVGGMYNIDSCPVSMLRIDEGQMFEDKMTEETCPPLSQRDIKVYNQIKNIRNILWELVEKEQAKAKERGESFEVMQEKFNVYPSYSQTLQGFFLEYYYGEPAYLHTPWGKVRLLRSFLSKEKWNRVNDELWARLKATEVIPQYLLEGYGTVGPIYAIHAIDSEVLSKPFMQAHEKYLHYKYVIDLWSKLERYA